MSSPEAPPETLVTDDGPGGGAVVLGAAWSRAGGPRNLRGIEDVLSALADAETTVWVDLEDAGSAELAELAGPLGLHPLVVEDILDRDQRAKVEYTGDVMHLVMFAAIPGRDLPELAEIDIVLTPRCLVTSHPPEWRPLEHGVPARMGAAHFLPKGTDAALYGVLDAIVDGYFPVIDQLTETVDELEDAAIERPDRSVVERLFAARRSLLLLRRAVSPEREVLNQLTNRDNPLIDDETLVYFRDVYDHLVRVTDELDTHRELLTGALDAYLSTVNNTLSDVMKRLTAVTAVLAGVGAVAGIFGMSEAVNAFDLREGSGFWVVTALVVMVGVFITWYFRRIDWI
ncbi:MAG: magnesium transporter CorA family protein [Candidatus Limnocylindrales bacterium]